MIQKCPECGSWCATVGENFFERGYKAVGRNISDISNVGEKLGDMIGLRKFGKALGTVVGVYTSPNRVFVDTIEGDKYKFECDKCGHCWGTDNDEEDETEYFEHECYVEELINEYSEIDVDDQKATDYLDKLFAASDSEYNTDITISMIHDTLAALFLEKSYSLDDDTKKEEGLALALNAINKSLSLFDDANSHITKGFILAESNKYSYYSALKELLYSREIESHTYFTIDSINKTYKNICEGYEEHFLEIPKEERKFLVLVSDYVAFPDNFHVLRLSSLPESLKFAGNNISENTLYVLHPLKDDTYIPYNEYSIELFREQLYEYRYIMECLGAKHFSIADIHSNNTESSQNNRFKVGGGGEYKGYAAQGGYESSSSCEEYSKLYNELSQEIHCELSNEPYIPEDTLWYHHNVEWKRNCDSRLQGRMLTFKQRVSNKLNTGLTKANSKNIEAELNAMIAKINGNYGSDTKFSIKEDAEHTWEISVEFYPMSDYNQRSIQNETPSAFISKNEQEYISEVKFCLESYGEITVKERRLLERTRERLSISNERAKELEDLFVVGKQAKRKWWKFWR